MEAKTEVSPSALNDSRNPNIRIAEVRTSGQDSVVSKGGAAKSRGQVAYEEDVRREPNYHDGQPRLAWHELATVTRWSWERNPTVRAKDSA